jgi:hypothetical protein
MIQYLFSEHPINIEALLITRADLASLPYGLFHALRGVRSNLNGKSRSIFRGDVQAVLEEFIGGWSWTRGYKVNRHLGGFQT